MILAFNGYKGSGKTAASEYLISEYGFDRVSFAEPMKRSAAAALGTTVERLEEMKNDPRAVITIKGDWFDSSDRCPDPAWVPGFTHTITIRQYLQYYGTEAHRDIFGEDFWTNQGVAEIKHIQAQDGILREETRIVIDDCRFENETRALINLGAKIVLIDRPGLEGPADAHPSERLPGVYDALIVNDGSLDDLYRKLDSLASA